jgi:signal transduction histidine kinase
MLLRPRILIATTAALSASVTLLFALDPGLHVAYRDPALHAALETAAALVTLLAAYLALGRFQARGSLDGLLLVCGLTLLAVSDLTFAAIPAALRGDRHGVFATWSVIVGRLGGAVLFAASSFAPARRLPRKKLAAVVALALCALYVAATAITVALLGSHLPRGLNPAVGGARPRLNAIAAVSAVQLLSVAIFAAAAWGFLRRAERSRDRFVRWLAIAAVIAAASRVNYYLYPSLYSQWVYVGDGFRLLFCILLLVGSFAEIQGYWRRLTGAAVLEERRRLARDLHDGLAQEIAYISRNAAWLASNGSDAVVAERIRAAADRAFDEARRAITVLAAPVDAPAEEVLSAALRTVAARHDTRLELDLAGAEPLEPERLEAVVRVACEAVANAARHSGAGTVRVELEHKRNRNRVRLRVVDLGTGFDPDAEATGYGLVSMRERAEAIGGRIWIDSAPGRGTIVEALL